MHKNLEHRASLEVCCLLPASVWCSTINVTYTVIMKYKAAVYRHYCVL